MLWHSRLVAALVACVAVTGCSYDADVSFDQSSAFPSSDSLTASEKPAPSQAPGAKPASSPHPADAPSDDASADDPASAEPPAADPEPTGDPSNDPVAPSTEPDDTQLYGIVAAHNAVRSSVSPAPVTPLGSLVWSEDAASVARAWAGNCQFGHNPSRRNFGENIFAASAGYGASPQGVVQDWASESSNYDYASNGCSGVCGHYTQLVWADTTSVGCAVQQCSTGSPFGGGGWELWVCDYGPPGNYVGQRPY